MNQSRQPKGVPVGGQYAENQHDEATASLADRIVREVTSAPSVEDILNRNPARANRHVIEESRSLNDGNDAEWVAAHAPGSSSSIDDARLRGSWARLKEIAEDSRDSRGFEPYTFSTPKGEEFFSPDGDEDDSAGVDIHVGSRVAAFQNIPKTCVREIEEDIANGVRAGSLSPLFDYEVSLVSDPSADTVDGRQCLTVTMTLKPGTEQKLYQDVNRARTSINPRYSPRVIGTVTRIGERLGAYRTVHIDADEGYVRGRSLDISVKSNLRGLDYFPPDSRRQ